MSLLDPLLPTGGGGRGTECIAAGWASKLLEACRGSLRHWWRTTTDAEFLESRISRRPSWRYILPAVGIAGTCVDSVVAIQSAAHDPGLATAPLVDLLCVAVAFAYARSPLKSSSLAMDLFISFMAIIGSILYSQDLDAQSLACEPFGAVEWVNAIVLMSIVGAHGLVIIVFWLLCASQCLMVATSETLVILGWASMVAIGALGLEFLVASLHRQLRSELRCKELLLDSATDGCGVVDITSGVVLEASTKMLKTLDCPEFVGRTLQSLVSHCDQAALAHFFGDAHKEMVPSPVLVTCTSNSKHFDLRMVPFAMDETQIGFCVQLVGEVRSSRFHGSLAPPVAAAAAQEEGAAGERASEGDVEEGDGLAPGQPGSCHDAASSHGANEAALASEAAHGRMRWTSGGVQRPSFRQGSEECRTRATLSLSSWTILSGGNSAAAAAAVAAAANAKKTKKVETRTIAIQASRRDRPPRPATSSDFPTAEQLRAARRARLARRSAAVVHEGRPQNAAFKATPQTTRLQALQMVASCCNVTGSGCCGMHIAWMGLQGLISEVMLKPCAAFEHCSGWQCPQCFSVQEQLAGPGEDEFCPICIDVVTPVLPKKLVPRVDLREQAVRTAAAAAAAAGEEAQDSSTSDFSDDDSGADTEDSDREGQEPAAASSVGFHS